MIRRKIPLKARKALLEGKVSEATKLIGDYYSIQGTVVEGRRLGRTLGFPTANLKLNEFSPLFLANGVYAVRIQYQSELYNGMVNVGIRPTMEQHELTIEVNLFEFSKDIYGQELTLFFIDRIRDEMKFPNLDALKEQISNDKMQIINLLSNRFQSNADAK
jgi:riboflavin kinase / FMN adenylyltransferase